MAPNAHPHATEYGQTRSTSRRVTAQHTLERVRNNQRRHRARQREYIAMLELKLREAELCITTLREQVDAVQAELVQYRNQDIPNLSPVQLETIDGTLAVPQPTIGGADSQMLGLPPAAMERDTLTLSSPLLFQRLLPDGLLGPELLDVASPHTSRDSGHDEASDLTTSEIFLPLEPNTQFSNHDTVSPKVSASWLPGGAEGCPPCSPNVADVALRRANYSVIKDTEFWLSAAAPLDTMPLITKTCCSSRRSLQPNTIFEGENITDFDLENPPSLPGYISPPSVQSRHECRAENESTMLCAEAYLLIEQQNFKGVGHKDVATWLWTGFRKSLNPGEGCRVKTDLLFSLLAFISEA